MTCLTTPGLEQSIAKGWGICLLAYVDHPDGEVRMWSGIGTKRFRGNTYEGVGRLGGIAPIGGSRTLGVRTISFILSGVPQSATEWLNKDVRGRAARAWIAGLRPDGRINGDPWLVAEGACDYMELEPDASRNVTIKLMVTEPIWSVERAQKLAFTPQWARKTFGDDITGFDDIPGMRNKTVNWTRT